MPDIKFKTKDEIPAELREHAKEADGTWSVNVVANEVHKGFRENNINLLQERDGLTSSKRALTDILGYDDPAKLKAELTDLRTTAQKVKDGTLKGSDAIEAEVARRLAAKTGEVEGQVASLQEQVQASNQLAASSTGKFRSLLLNQHVAQVVLAGDSGFNPSALSDIQARARAVWQVGEDDTPVPMANGKVLYSKKEPGTPMPMKEWLAGLLAEAPHFGKSSAGGGAGGGQGELGEMTAGMPTAEFNKLPPQERIRRHRAAQRK